MDHAGIEALLNGFISGPGLKIFVEDVSPWSLDGILFSIFLGAKYVLEPLLGSISSNLLDSSFAFTIGFFRVCLVQFIQIRR